MNENTPKQTVINFLKCWQKRNFKKMVEFTQLTWRSDKGKGAKQFLRDFYGLKNLIYFEILQEKTPSGFAEIVKDIEIFIKYKLPNGIQKKKITARILCETGPYQVSKDGTWGVNPIGALKEY